MIKNCGTCGNDEIADASVRAWYCTPAGSNQTSIKWMCLNDAASLERRGATVTIVLTNAQRATALAWDRAGIGAN